MLKAFFILKFMFIVKKNAEIGCVQNVSTLIFINYPLTMFIYSPTDIYRYYNSCFFNGILK